MSTTLDVRTVPLVGRQLIEASAGTGKTWTITALVLRLLLEAERDIRQLLVVTFTKAATAELRERIWLRLLEARAALEADEAPADPFLAWLCERFPVGEAREQALLRLEAARRGFDEAAVYTIHGFCQRVLGESENATGLEEAQLEGDDRELLAVLVREVWVAEFQALPAWQAALARQELTPDIIRGDCELRLLKPYLQLVATPPAGDFEAYARAFAALAQAWVAARPELAKLLDLQVLSKTSYGKVGEWLDQLDAWLAGPASLPAGLSTTLEKLTPAKLAAGTKKGQTTPAHPVFDLVAELLAQAAAIQAGSLPTLRQRMGEVVMARLSEHKARLGRQSFQDLLDALGQSMAGPGGPLLAARVREQFPAALIDEFQDTDPTQFAIFDAIYPVEENGQTSLFLVGDPKQAIYSFRGADINTYLAARQSAAAEWGLDVNRRSRQSLIDGFAALFAAHRPFLLQGLAYPPVRAADAGEGVVFPDHFAALQLLRLPDQPQVDAKGKEKLLGKGQANTLSAQGCAAEIARLLAAAGEVSLKGRPLRPGDIAVLVPTHRQGALMAEALTELGIPAVRQGQDSVWASPEAQDLLLLLEALEQPAAPGRQAAALLTSLLGLSVEQVWAEQEDEALASQRLEQFLALREKWRQRGFMAMWTQLSRDFGLTTRLASREGGERRLTNIRHLVELLQAKAQTLPTLEGQLAWYAAQLSEPEGQREEHQLRLESDAERVQIVTVHTSKGLQYPLVFCPFLWDGQLLRRDETLRVEFTQAGQGWLDLGSADLAQHQGQAEAERLAEKLRLLYVALTRAQYRCYLGWGRVEGYDSAALTWLLAGGADDLAGLQEKVGGLDWEVRLASLREASGGAFDWSDLLVDEALAGTLGQQAQPELSLAQASRSLSIGWQVGSFTGLSQHEVEVQEQPDHDTQVLPLPQDSLLEASEPASALDGFPAGARAGICWHAIFEETPFEKVQPEAFTALVGQKLQQHGFDDQLWQEPVSRHFLQVLRQPLDGGQLTLAGLEDYRVEMEFLYPVTGLTTAGLRQAASREALPAAYTQALARLDFQQLTGFLKGFIDLIFCHEGRYYVLDYKSNKLGPAAAYAPERLSDAMAHHHYYLQYWLYGVALHRHLRRRLPDYDYDRHIGGVYYLFLRGMRPGTAQGIYHHKPSRALIEALDAWLEGGL